MAADPAALERITAHLASRRDDQPGRRDIIRVSSAGECSRKIGYRLLGFTAEAATVNEIVTFEVGHSYHHMVQKWLIEMGWTEPGLLEFNLADPAIRSRGSCDCVTTRLNKQGHPDPEGTRRLIEIKSITNVAQERYGKVSEGAFNRLDKPRDYHLDQANMYAHMWNQRIATWDDPLGTVDPVHDRVEHITMIYVGKDTSDCPIKVYTQPVSEKRIKRLQEKFLTIWSHVDREELPPRDHNPFSGYPPCTFCPYLALCLADAER